MVKNYNNYSELNNTQNKCKNNNETDGQEKGEETEEEKGEEEKKKKKVLHVLRNQYQEHIPKEGDLYTDINNNTTTCSNKKENNIIIKNENEESNTLFNLCNNNSYMGDTPSDDNAFTSSSNMCHRSNNSSGSTISRISNSSTSSNSNDISISNSSSNISSNRSSNSSSNSSNNTPVYNKTTIETTYREEDKKKILLRSENINFKNNYNNKNILNDYSCLKGYTFQSFNDNRTYNEICSISENKFIKLIKKNEKDVIKYNQKTLTRVYPSGTRLASTNFNPLVFWSAGIQFVALNYQYNGLSMLLNKGRFSENGGRNSGYILKPTCLRYNDNDERKKNEDYKALSLDLQILALHQINLLFSIKNKYHEKKLKKKLFKMDMIQHIQTHKKDNKNVKKFKELQKLEEKKNFFFSFSDIQSDDITTTVATSTTTATIATTPTTTTNTTTDEVNVNSTSSNKKKKKKKRNTRNIFNPI
uniref:Phosphoinositide phospholipase C n=1 Tax=Piliocolobus tephrosceles TaxID=591936 RepID=A0A8C9GG22_9PRIM